MRRRRYLAALGVGTGGLLAGCSSDGESTTAGSTAGTATGDGSSTPAVAESFELTALHVPETTTLNEPWAFGFSVRNTTEERRTFRSTLSSRVHDRGTESSPTPSTGSPTTGADDEGWTRFQGDISFAVDPGKAKTWRSPRFRFRYLRTVTYRLDAFGRTWTVEVRPLQLDYGHTYTSPVGLQITVGQVTFRDEKPGGSGDDTTPTGTPTATPTQPPPTAADTGGTKWAVVPITVANPTEQARPAPFPQEFAFYVGDRTYEDVALDHPDLYHRDRALETGEPLSGNLYFEVPAGADANDVRVVLTRSYSEGDIEVAWDR